MHFYKYVIAQVSAKNEMISNEPYERQEAPVEKQVFGLPSGLGNEVIKLEIRWGFWSADEFGGTSLAYW